jgi:nitroimidazol reductase NimA-like FMN-containing flavoprotein (pyridoxamine 5'-phosphate oxidase superfamily)
MTALTYLIDIDPEGCADLLASCNLGRLGVIVDGRPEIFPVNHVYDRPSGCVVFPTNTRTKLRAALDWPWVAFEVDAVQPDDSGGWSVLVVGRAEAIDDPALIARAARERRVLWAAGGDVQWVRIVPSKVTGRRICASDKGVDVGIR